MLSERLLCLPGGDGLGGAASRGAASPLLRLHHPLLVDARGAGTGGDHHRRHKDHLVRAQIPNMIMTHGILGALSCGLSFSNRQRSTFETTATQPFEPTTPQPKLVPPHLLCLPESHVHLEALHRRRRVAKRIFSVSEFNYIYQYQISDISMHIKIDNININIY